MSGAVESSPVDPVVDPGSGGLAAPPVRHRWPAVLGSLVFVVGAVIVQMLRQAGSPMWRTMWAEDGRIFYMDALSAPIGELIFRPYAGYGLVGPRLLAQVATWLPAERASQWLVLSACLVSALLALFTYWASAPVLVAPLRRAFLAGSMILLPVLPLEIVGSISNIQWTFPIAVLFAVLLPVDRPWSIAARIPIVVLGPLGSPLCLVFAPIVVVQLVLVATRRRRGLSGPRLAVLVVPIAYLVACLGQLAIYAQAKQAPEVTMALPDKLAALIRLYPTRVVTDLVFGVRVTENLWGRFGYDLAAISMLLLGALLITKFLRSGKVTRIWMVCLVVGGAAIFAFSLFQRAELLRLMVIEGDGPYLFGGPRYEVVPALLLVLALLLPNELPSSLLTSTSPPSAARAGSPLSDARAGTTWGRLTGGLPWRAVVVVGVVWSTVALIPSFRLDNGRSLGPSWPNGVIQAQADCEDGDPPVGGVQVAISPQPDWAVTMTCGQVGR